MQTMSIESRFAVILAQDNDAVFILDTAGHCVTLNARALAILGVAPQQILGRSLREFIAGVDVPRWEDRLTRLQAGATMPVEEWMLKRAGGARVPVEINAYAVDENEADTLFICIARDIFERKQHERKMLEQVNILQQVTDAIIVTDMSGMILSWNHAAESIYGWAAEDVLGRKLVDVAPDVQNEHSENLLKEQYMIRGHWRSEISQRRRDGKLLHISSSVSLVKDESGVPVAMVTVNHNITKRKRAEIANRNYANHMAALRQVDAEISSTLDMDRVLNLALNAAVMLSGADAGFVLVNDEDGVPQMVHAYGAFDASRFRNLENPLYGVVARVMQTLQPEFIEDVSSDPDYVPDIPETVALMTFPLVIGERIVGTIHLETAQENYFTRQVADFLNLLVSRLAAAIDNARLHQLTRDQLKQLQLLEQLKTDMIRIASHDLRNPVGLVHGFLEVLRMDTEDRLTDEELDYIDTMQRAIGRMQHIIDDLLSLERIREMSAHQLNETVDLAEVLRKVHDEQADAARQRGQTLSLDVALESLVVNGDSTQLHEATVNLVSNAIKYTPDGGTVTLRADCSDGLVRIRVKDTGIGIREDQQTKLFQPFYRVQSEETARIEGTGLGLHLVKNIIERHRGSVYFDSVQGQGSIFGFDLPAATL